MKEKLQEYALLAEIFGGVAIVISLIYVGIQIQQNTNAIKSATIQDISRWSYDLTISAMENPELEDAMDAACNGTMNTSQFRLVRNLYTAGLRIYSNRYYQIQLGTIDEKTALSIGGRAIMYRLPIFKEMWEIIKIEFDEDFQNFIENEVLSLPVVDCLSQAE